MLLHRHWTTDRKSQPPEGQKVPVHGLSVQLQEQSGSGSVNVDAKAFNDFSDFVST